MQNRLKSKVMWMAVLAQVVLILTATGVIDIQVVDTVKIIGTSVIEVLTLFAVLNNPTDSKGF